MGFFSWKTADTDESIYNRYTDLVKPVYLLQPVNKDNILEPSYEGYGIFGDHDVGIWSAKFNCDPVLFKQLTDDQKRSAGIDLFSKKNIKYPLKFSFDKNAVYEDLPPSKNCPYQGFFV